MNDALTQTCCATDHASSDAPMLVEDASFAYPAVAAPTNDMADHNWLVHGDNLAALPALARVFGARVKCIYIDPPYNTGIARMHYADGMGHHAWLAAMGARLVWMRQLLAADGTLFCQLNDAEMAYGKVLLDDIFGRHNFLNQIGIRMKQTSGASGGGADRRLKKNLEYILVYTKDARSFAGFHDAFETSDLMTHIAHLRARNISWKYTRVLQHTGERRYLTTIHDAVGTAITIYEHHGVQTTTVKHLMAQTGSSEAQIYARHFGAIFRDTNAQSSIRSRVAQATVGAGPFLSITYKPRSGRQQGQDTTLFYRGPNRDLVAWLRDIAVQSPEGLRKRERIGTYWDGFHLNNVTKEGGVRFVHGKKPEALLRRVLQLATRPGDLVLDAYLGSGTTAAVAHKMGRRWLGIEAGEHITSHCVRRMRQVVDAQGGAYRFCRVASAKPAL